MLELALGNLQVKVVLLCSALREEVEHEEDITKKKQLWSISSFICGGIGNQTKKQKNKEGLAVRC